ncbi:MAG: S9 family peptidase [Opitutales bacterium]|nr:S9 family peptidase [Opitutales bacterium]
MKTKVYSVLWVVLFSIFSSFLSSEMIPVEDLFREPLFNTFAISPDGKTLATIADCEGSQNVFLLNLQTNEIALLTKETSDVDSVLWVNNKRIIYTLSNKKDDARSFDGGILAINIDGTELRALQEPYGSQVSNGVAFKGETIDIINRYSRDDDYVLISSNKRRAYYPDIYLMNVYTGKKKRVFNNPGKITAYVSSPRGSIRFGMEDDIKTGESKKVWFCNDEGGWELLWEYNDGTTYAEPIAIDDAKNIAYIQSNVGRDKFAIFKFDMTTKKLDPTPVYEDPVYDVEPQSIISKFNRTGIAGFSYQADKPVNVFFDDNYKNLQVAIDEALPDTYNTIYSKSEDGKQVVIMSYSDVQAPTFNRLNLATSEMVHLSDDRPWLKPELLCHTKPVEWTARDGRVIHGYLTLPKSWHEGDPVPFIVRPHGGPWAREEWGLTWHYPIERQYLANRGFGVLEVNFRGSTGYGKDHLLCSFKHPAKMNYDFLDGALWAIDQGYANPEKMGIMGASWGGYATMVGVTKFSDVFKFGVNFMGVVDLPMHIKRYLKRDKGTEYKTAAYDYWCQRIGDVENPDELKMLEEWSPINYIKNIQGPVFVYHGLEDQNVHIEQARALVSALKSEDKEFEEVIRVDEAHSTHFENDRIDTYTKIDEFLRKILTKK